MPTWAPGDMENHKAQHQVDHLKVTWKSILVAETCWNPLFRFRKRHIPYYDAKFLNSQCCTPTININISMFSFVDHCPVVILPPKNTRRKSYPLIERIFPKHRAFPQSFHLAASKVLARRGSGKQVGNCPWSIFGMSNFTFKIFQVPVEDYKYIPLFFPIVGWC